MEGDGGEGPSGGIVPATCGAMFAAIAGTTDREFLVRVSFVELYNEDIRDLLSKTPTNGPPPPTVLYYPLSISISILPKHDVQQSGPTLRSVCCKSVCRAFPSWQVTGTLKEIGGNKVFVCKHDLHPVCIKPRGADHFSVSKLPFAALALREAGKDRHIKGLSTFVVRSAADILRLRRRAPPWARSTSLLTHHDTTYAEHRAI